MSGPADGRPGPDNSRRAEGVRETLVHRRQTRDYWYPDEENLLWLWDRDMGEEGTDGDDA